MRILAVAVTCAVASTRGKLSRGIRSSRSTGKSTEYTQHTSYLISTRLVKRPNRYARGFWRQSPSERGRHSSSPFLYYQAPSLSTKATRINLIRSWLPARPIGLGQDWRPCPSRKRHVDWRRLAPERRLAEAQFPSPLPPGKRALEGMHCILSVNRSLEEQPNKTEAQADTGQPLADLPGCIVPMRGRSSHRRPRQLQAYHSFPPMLRLQKRRHARCSSSAEAQRYGQWSLVLGIEGSMPTRVVIDRKRKCRARSGSPGPKSVRLFPRRGPGQPWLSLPFIPFD